MILYTNNRLFAETYLGVKIDWTAGLAALDEKTQPLSERLFGTDRIYTGNGGAVSGWKHLFLIDRAENSQYDVIVELMREHLMPPHGTICIAGSGEKFHGQKNRPWRSLPGNIHLTAFLAPDRVIPNYGTGIIVVSAISVLQTLDSISGLKGKATIKWINDILIGKAKVCGVIANAQTEGTTVAGVVIGIGLNVETTPEIEPTIFVPAAASISDFVQDPAQCTISSVFNKLISNLYRNYRDLTGGGYPGQLNLYRERSVVVGKNVKIFTDFHDGTSVETAGGIVESIGENLELKIKGYGRIISTGRLALMA